MYADVFTATYTILYIIHLLTYLLTYNDIAVVNVILHHSGLHISCIYLTLDDVECNVLCIIVKYRGLCFVFSGYPNPIRDSGSEN